MLGAPIHRRFRPTRCAPPPFSAAACLAWPLSVPRGAGERPREQFRKLEDVFGGGKPGARAGRRASPRKARGPLGGDTAKAAPPPGAAAAAPHASDGADAELLLSLRAKAAAERPAAEAEKPGGAPAAPDGKPAAAAAEARPEAAEGKAEGKAARAGRGGSPARAGPAGAPKKGASPARPGGRSKAAARGARAGARQGSPAAAGRLARAKQPQNAQEKRPAPAKAPPPKGAPKPRAAPAAARKRPRAAWAGPAASSPAAQAGAAAGAAGVAAAARARAAAGHAPPADKPAELGKRRRVSFKMPEAPVATRPRPAEDPRDADGGLRRWAAPGLALAGALPLKLRLKTDFAWSCMSAFQRGCATLKAHDAAAPRGP